MGVKTGLGNSGCQISLNHLTKLPAGGNLVKTTLPSCGNLVGVATSKLQLTVQFQTLFMLSASNLLGNLRYSPAKRRYLNVSAFYVRISVYLAFRCASLTMHSVTREHTSDRRARPSQNTKEQKGIPSFALRNLNFQAFCLRRRNSSCQPSLKQE